MIAVNGLAYPEATSDETPLETSFPPFSTASQATIHNPIKVRKEPDGTTSVITKKATVRIA